MEYHDVYGYKFPSEEAASKAEREILSTVGQVVTREGASLSISAPSDFASKAAQIAEKHGGKMTIGSV